MSTDDYTQKILYNFLEDENVRNSKIQSMEFLFENIHMISNRRGLNCNAQQCYFITFYFVDERKVACYKHGVIMQKWILSKKQTNTVENYENSDGNFRLNF